VTIWLITFNFIHFMAAFWAVFTFGGSGPALTAHGSLDLKQEIQIQTIDTVSYTNDQNKRTWGNGAFFVFLQYMRRFEQIISRSSRDDNQEQVNF
jgi:hypothetical protein